MKKILVIDPGKGWGHFVSKIYAFRALSENLNSKITFLTKESTQAEAYLKNEDFCEEIIYLQEFRGGLNKIIGNIKENLFQIRRLKNLKIDTCYIFHPSCRFVFMAYLANIKNIYGLGYRYQNFFLKKNKKLYTSFFSQCVPNDNEAVKFVEKLFNIDKINFKPMNNSSNEKNTLIAIGIASSEEEKRWSIDSYIEIVKYLLKKNHSNFLIISGRDQSKEEEYIKEKLNNNNINLIFTSKKKIFEVIPDMLKCKFYVGNYTGFAHLFINYGINCHIIYGNCVPQYYSKSINIIDKDKNVERSDTSIKTIEVNKVIESLQPNFT